MIKGKNDGISGVFVGYIITTLISWIDGEGKTLFEIIKSQIAYMKKLKIY